MKQHHYIYKVTLPETDEFYFGCRTSKIEPIYDIKYKGSMKAWKVDKSKLTKQIISEFDSRDEANEAEWFLINLFRNILKDPLCMNVNNNINWCRYGTKHREEAISKMINSHTGKKFTEEHKHSISEGNKGIKRSDETKLRMSIAKKGHSTSEETRRKISEAMKAKSNIAGIPKSEETKRKMKESWVKRRIKKLLMST